MSNIDSRSPADADAAAMPTSPIEASPSQRSPHSPPPQLTQRPRAFPQLLAPQIFHPLPYHELPAPFRNPSLQPSPTASADDLVRSGHFRAAAITAANTLRTLNPTNHDSIFRLWYIRLACLTLISATNLAATEVKALEDLSAPVYRELRTGRHIVPWELRVLVVRLQAIGFGDWRRAIVFYYQLAGEARVEALAAHKSGDATERDLWRRRLADLGIRVASALVEMNDYGAAARHLESLLYNKPRSDSEEEKYNIKVKHMLGLLYIRVGNFMAAKQAIGEDENQRDEIIDALGLMAGAKWEDAVNAWRELSGKDGVANEMTRQNLAVCLLYTGKLREAWDLLEDLVEEGSAFHGLIFNLSTIYEICSDDPKSMKLELAEKVATHGKAEMNAASFKMV